MRRRRRSIFSPNVASPADCPCCLRDPAPAARAVRAKRSLENHEIAYRRALGDGHRALDRVVDERARPGG